MKNLFYDFEEAENLVNAVSEFDFFTIQSLVCMMIDTAAAKYKESATEMADSICVAVHEVNETFGAYQIF